MPKSHSGSQVNGRKLRIRHRKRSKGVNGTDAVTACASISAHRLAPARSITSQANNSVVLAFFKVELLKLLLFPINLKTAPFLFSS